MVAPARPRLYALLDEASTRPTTMLIAPAAFGKSTAINNWLRDRPAMADRQVQLPPDYASTSGQRVLHDLPANRLIVADGFLDDADPTELSELLATAFRHGHQLLAAMRNRPKLNLGARGVRDQLQVIGPGDLAFTRVEAAAVLNAQVPEISAEMIEELWSATFGWPGLLDRVRGGAQWDTRGQVQSLFNEFIEDEVLTGLPDSVRDMLSSVCVVDKVCGDLARQVCDDPNAYAVLANLSRHGVPVSLDKPDTVGVPPVINEALRRRLSDTAPERLAALRRVAAEHLVGNGDPVRGIALAVDSGDREFAARLLRDTVLHSRHHLHPALLDQLTRVRHAAAIGPGEAKLLRRLITSTPEDVAVSEAAVTRSILAHGPPSTQWSPMLLSHRWELLSAAGTERTEPAELLADTEEVLANPDRYAPSQMAYLQISYAGYLTQTGVLDRAEEILRLAVAGAETEQLSWVLVRGYGLLAWVHALRIGSQETVRLAEQAEQAARGDPALAAMLTPARAARARWAIHRGELDDARYWLDRAGPDLVPTARVALQVWIDVLAGEADRALRRTDELRRVTPAEALPHEEVRLAIATFMAAVDLGDPDRVRAELAVIEASNAMPEMFRPEAGQAAIMMLTERSREAHELIFGAARAAGYGNDVTTLWIWSGVAVSADAIGDHPAAMDALDHVERISKSLGLDVPKAAHRHVMADFEDRVNLTPAEHHVLENLIDNDTLVVIADRMYISTNTLKTHLQRIYRKLGVSGRKDAVRRARLLRLI